jgi:glycosyltransferase involved in cell wall biosynthesis
VDGSERQARVLQVVLSLNPGGTERLVIDLVTRLHAEVPMGVCCLDEPGAWASEVERLGVRVTALGRRPGFHPSLGAAIARAAAGHRATAIHAHHYSPFVYSAIARVRRPETRLVFTEHGRVSDAPPSTKRRVANLVLARLATEAFAVSADLRTHLLAEGFPPSAMGVIHNGIDIGPLPSPADREAVRRDLGAGVETLVVGTIARLDPVKHLEALLAAAARARTADGPPILVVVIGDGPERAALDERAAALGISDHVRFLGRRDDARRWLAGMDVYVNSSVSEGISLTILEAMAAGLPVVATRVGGTPEIVDETSGVLVPARDVPAIAGALAELGADAARRRALGAAARARVESAFTLDRMVAAYRDIYERTA